MLIMMMLLTMIDYLDLIGPDDPGYIGATVFSQTNQSSEDIIENDDIYYNSLYPSEIISSAFTPEYGIEDQIENPIINLSGRVIPYMEEPNIDLSFNVEVMRNLFMNARHTILTRAIVDTVYTDVPIPRQINIGLGAIEYNPLQLPYFTSSENGDINVVNINTMDTMEEVD